MADPIDERLREIREKLAGRKRMREGVPGHIQALFVENQQDRDIAHLLDLITSLREVERAARVIRRPSEGPPEDIKRWERLSDAVIANDATHRPPLSGDGE